MRAEEINRWIDQQLESEDTGFVEVTHWERGERGLRRVTRPANALRVHYVATDFDSLWDLAQKVFVLLSELGIKTKERTMIHVKERDWYRFLGEEYSATFTLHLVEPLRVKDFERLRREARKRTREWIKEGLIPDLTLGGLELSFIPVVD